MDEILTKYRNILDENTGHHSLETLARYANLPELLSQYEITFLENHIKNCSKCKSNLDNIFKEDKEIDTGNSTSPQIFRLPTFIKYSAAASIILALGVLLYYSCTIQPQEEVVVENSIIENTIEESQVDTTKFVELKDEKLDKIIEEESESVSNELYAENNP